MAQQPAKKTPAAQMAEGYEITVSGQYYARNQETSVKAVRTYKPEKFQFPKIVQYKKGMKKVTITSEDGTEINKVVPDIVPANAANVALHLIKNFYIGPRLKSKYEDFIDIRTCAVFSKEAILIDVAKVGDVTTKNIQEMDEAELRQFVTINDITVSFSNYNDLADLKNAVALAVAQKKQDDIAAGKSAGMTEEEALLQEPTNLFS